MSNNFSSQLFPPTNGCFGFPPSPPPFFFLFKPGILTPPFLIFILTVKTFASLSAVNCLKNASVSAKFSVTAKIVDQSTVFTEDGSMLFHKAVIFILTGVL